eukprot:gene13799-29342_t
MADIVNASWNFLVVTGASKGLGKAIALAFAKSTKNPLHVVLTGRSGDGLEAIRTALMSARESHETVCELMPADLSDLKTLPTTTESLFAIKSDRLYSKAILINNAGSLGRLATIGSGETLSDFSDALDFNITSSCYLSSKFVEKFVKNTTLTKSSLIINISSLCAIQAFESWGIYCAGKAAREMYAKVLAQELKSNTTFKILNYAPGPLDTEMQREIRECETADQNTRDYFQKMFESGQLVNCDHSAQKLVDILEKDTFDSGAHIDYFDEI